MIVVAGLRRCTTSMQGQWPPAITWRAEGFLPTDASVCPPRDAWLGPYRCLRRPWLRACVCFVTWRADRYPLSPLGYMIEGLVEQGDIALLQVCAFGGLRCNSHRQSVSQSVSESVSQSLLDVAQVAARLAACSFVHPPGCLPAASGDVGYSTCYLFEHASVLLCPGSALQHVTTFCNNNDDDDAGLVRRDRSQRLSRCCT